MNLNQIGGKIAGAVSLLTLALLPAASHADVEGAGATFPAPIYQKWFAKYKSETGTGVNYQSVGSGAGIKAIHDKTVDFGASDAPLSAAEEATMPGPIVHIPTVGGAVVLAYHAAGVPAGLKLTGDTIADIYMGKIKSWNDPKIKAVNPGVNLPSTAIQPVHRTDGSGTTYIFTNYLKRVSGEWASSSGAGKSVNWPVGLGGKGNEGVAAVVNRTDGGIGYVELAYAIEHKLAFAAVRNRAGKFVTASAASTTAAIGQYATELSRDIKTPTVDAVGADSYPICSLTYILLYRTGGRNAAAATKLWSWCMQPAQQGDAGSLYYAQLPPALVKINEANLKTIH